jgi:hypothetical protein
MLRTTQLRFMARFMARFTAIALFAVAAASLTTTSARAFSSGNGGAAGGGNAAFGDPDDQINKAFGLDQGGEPSRLGSPGQLDPQPGQSNPYKNFYKNYRPDSLTSPPNPLSRPSN